MSMVNSKEKYALLDKLGLCHRCEKSKPLLNKKFCADCLEKISDYNAKHYDSKKAHEYQKKRKEQYQIKKNNGICVRCSKKATHGIYCYEHSIQAKRHNKKTSERRKREREDRGLIPQQRAKSGLCLRCGSPIDVEGYKLCSICIEQNRKNSKLADKSYWRKIESARYNNVKERRRKDVN